MGTTGLETAFAALHTGLVVPGTLELGTLVERMTAGAAVYDLPVPGIAAGEPANLVLVDPNARWTVEPSKMATMGRNSPFAGRELPGAVKATFFGGHPTVLDGVLNTPRRFGGDFGGIFGGEY